MLTGAAGAIGSELRRALGARVGSLRLVDWAPISELGEREQVAVVDLADLESLVAACDGADGVVHLAGIADEADFHALAETNVVGTYHALEAARRNGVPRFIYASSNRVTGFYDVAERVTPDFPARPDGFYDVSRSPPRRFAGSTATSSGSPSRRFASAASSRRRRSRHLSTWLSPGDCVRAFIAAMTAPDLTFAIFYAVSANESRWWDVDAGRALGFEPVDPARTRINAYSVPVVPVVRVGDWIRLWMRARGCSSVYP